MEHEQLIIPLLKEFGLAEDDAQLYLGLLRIGSAKASEISHYTKTDRVKGYKILESLKNQGFVVSTFTSPTLFSPANPKKSLQKIIQKRREEVAKLENNMSKLLELLNKIKLGKTETNLPKLTIISGRNNIYEQIIRIIDETKDELYIVTNPTDLIRMYYTEIPEAISKAIKRKVNIKLMTEVEVTTKMDCVKRLGVKNFKIAKLPSQGRIVSNNNQILMSGYTSSSKYQTNEDSALITNSDEICGNMMSLCKFLWKMGKELNVDDKNYSENNVEDYLENYTTALVVDDDSDAVEMFSDYLELKGLKVAEKCYGGKQAVQAYKKVNPDVVFLDVNMPEYDGFYALKKIREINRKAKIIMVTADFTQETKKRLKEMNPTDVIYKPYNIDKLLTSLKKEKIKPSKS